MPKVYLNNKIVKYIAERFFFHRSKISGRLLPTLIFKIDLKILSLNIPRKLEEMITSMK